MGLHYLIQNFDMVLSYLLMHLTLLFGDRDGNVLEYPAASMLREVRQQVNPQHWQPPTTLQDVRLQNTVIFTFIALRTSTLSRAIIIFK